VYPSTAAQYFHALRRQARTERAGCRWCASPRKRYLRMAQSRSPLDALTRDRFHRVLGDRSPDLDPGAVRGCWCARGRSPTSSWTPATRSVRRWP